jgi:hypothetical protein
VSDGIGDERRRGRFAKATCGLRRLVLLGHSGIITLESLRWLRDVGAALLQVDADGEVIAAWGPMGLNNSRLRRAQALALGKGVGMKAARELVRRKLVGQFSLLAHIPRGSSFGDRHPQEPGRSQTRLDSRAASPVRVFRRRSVLESLGGHPDPVRTAG